MTFDLLLFQLLMKLFLRTTPMSTRLDQTKNNNNSNAKKQKVTHTWIITDLSPENDLP